MPTPLRRRLRLTRRYAFYALAALVVVAALTVGSLSQLLPFIEQRPQQVAHWLSERAGRPVAFDGLKTTWTRRGPLLQLDGLRIGEGEGVRIGQAEVLVSLYAGLFPGASFTELRLRGLSLTLQREDDGRWEVRGLPSAGNGGDPLEALRSLGELQVIGGKLQVHASSLGIDAQVPRVDLRLRVDGERLRVGARGWIDQAAPPLTAVLDFARDSGDGTAWLSAAPADLAAWSSLLQFAGIQLAQGRGELRSWISLRDYRVAAVTADAQVRDVTLKGTPFKQGGSRPEAAFEQLQVRARWKAIDGGWRLDAPKLRIGVDERAVENLDGLLIAGGTRYALQGEQVDITALLQTAALSNQASPTLRQWLYEARPRLRFAHVDVAGTANGALRGSGDLEEAAFDAVGDAPGLSGLRGHFRGDGDGVSLGLKAERAMRFDWPRGFGVAHDVQLAGDLVVWPEGQGWRVGTPAMRVQGTDYAADVRGSVWFQGDGTRPWLELAAKLDEVPMIAAKRFWVRSHMSQAAVDWLDGAIVDGHISNGYGLVTGDLDDWPFDGNNGRFEAAGRIDAGQIRFHQDWPVMQQVDADISFIGNGFSMQGRGNLAGVPIHRFEAGISDFKQSALYVRANALSDTSRLQQMLKQSPLHQQYASTLDNLVVSGPAAVSFDLLQPLHHDSAGHLRGEIELRGAQLADPRWDVAFENVRGKAHYSSEGFEAPALSVRHRGQDGVLSLRAGGHVRDPSQVFESSLSAMLDAGQLLDRAPELVWLKPHISGTSLWSIGVDLPKATPGSAAEPPTRLQLRSDLVGTRLSLPAPLDKPASEPLLTTVEASLPLGSGQVDVAFGRLLALAARSQAGKTGVHVTLGNNKVDRAPPADGLSVSGRTASLDALEWINLARGAQPASAAAPVESGLALRDVDVLAEQLLLIGGQFEQTRLQLRPGPRAVTVQLAGPALAGQLIVPNADGGTIAGKLARVHWQALPKPDSGMVDAPSTDSETDPAKVPALALEIEDLQFGKVKLGQTSLKTRPVANGLEVEQLQFRSPRQSIDVSGAWTGTGAAARTQLSAKVHSEDMGSLVQNLGYGGQLRGGQGDVSFDAGWPGGPAQFTLAALEGQLTLQARNGQLLEVEPGAGRVLGLLSVAQLPRRLMLDFRDFFSKGLAFNQVEGKVQFGAGVARTDKMAIEGPAANIVIRGQADLRTQQFDQTIDVNPRSGNLLTVVGAVAGGPVGAAVGAAANAVLSKPLGEIGAKTYKVTGPWKDPKVEVLDRDAAQPPPASPATAP